METVKVYAMYDGKLTEGHIRKNQTEEEALEDAQSLFENDNKLQWVYVPLWQFRKEEEETEVV